MDRRSLLLGRRVAAALPSASRPEADALRMPPSVAPPYAGGLAPFTPGADAPWDARRARHLLRRTGFHAPLAAIAEALGRTPAQAAGRIVDAALAAPLPPVPSYAELFPPPANATADEKNAYNSANSAAFRAEADGVFAEALDMRVPGTALRERLALALSSVVTASYAQYGNRAHRLVRYWAVLRQNALGSYETLIRDMGRTPAMLDYLDGNLNKVGAPNENYARELLELFTAGEFGPDGRPTYTQRDVSEMARCLTGWTAPSASNDALFVASRFDAGQKTILGKTGAFGYDEAMSLIFSERAEAVAYRLAGVLYRTFVAGAENAQVVAELAAVLRANAFRIAPAVRALVASQHFFSIGVLGARIASPFDLLVGLVGASGYSAPQAQFGTLRTQARDMGFDLFNPPDVKGWGGGREWLDTGRMPSRWTATDRLWSRKSEARALAATMDPTPVPSALDPNGLANALVKALAEHVLAVPLPAATQDEALALMLGGIPYYEWNATAPSSEGRIRALLQFLSRLPEAQLA